MAELAPIEPASDVVEDHRRQPWRDATRNGYHDRRGRVDWLAPRTVLVLLDNCEHVVDAVRTFVERVLRLCPGVTFLLTSREALALDGERCWLTRPLALPPTEVEEPDEASRYEAIELFCCPGNGSGPDFGLYPENVGTSQPSAVVFDGIPLALELAAARLPALGPVELLDHLDQPFRLLVSPANPVARCVAPSTDPTGCSTIATAAVQAAGRVSPAAGRSTASTTVCFRSRLDADDVLDVLTELVAKSLVTTETTPTGTRYQMLETLRHYGQERMDEQSESDGVCRRHAQWARGARPAGSSRSQGTGRKGER